MSDTEGNGPNGQEEGVDMADFAKIADRMVQMMDTTLQDLKTDFGKLESECKAIRSELAGKEPSASIDLKLKPIKVDVSALKKLHRDVWLIAMIGCLVLWGPSGTGYEAGAGVGAISLKMLWPLIRDRLKPPEEET